MMTNNVMSFKKIEIVGASKEAAINDANLGFSIAGDATQAYKNWLKAQTGAITEKDVKQFMIDYLQKKVKCAAGVGYIITIESAVADTRERPWTITDVKNEKGKRKFKKVYRLIDDATGEVLGTNDQTKAAAKQLAKDIIADGFHGKMTCYIGKDVADGEPIAFKAEYTPSKAAKHGRWLVFGNEV
jgi:flavin-binding protein dodecin